MSVGGSLWVGVVSFGMVVAKTHSAVVAARGVRGMVPRGVPAYGTQRCPRLILMVPPRQAEFSKTEEFGDPLL